MVLSKLLASLPVMRSHLRAGYLLGDSRSDKSNSGLAMNNKVGVCACVCACVCVCIVGRIGIVGATL
jgi:hypothetical protein